jgi:hypothetical protein
VSQDGTLIYELPPGAGSSSRPAKPRARKAIPRARQPQS